MPCLALSCLVLSCLVCLSIYVQIEYRPDQVPRDRSLRPALARMPMPRDSIRFYLCKQESPPRRARSGWRGKKGGVREELSERPGGRTRPSNSSPSVTGSVLEEGGWGPIFFTRRAAVRLPTGPTTAMPAIRPRGLPSPFSSARILGGPTPPTTPRACFADGAAYVGR